MRRACAACAGPCAGPCAELELFFSSNFKRGQSTLTGVSFSALCGFCIGIGPVSANVHVKCVHASRICLQVCCIRSCRQSPAVLLGVLQAFIFVSFSYSTCLPARAYTCTVCVDANMTI